MHIYVHYTFGYIFTIHAYVCITKQTREDSRFRCLAKYYLRSSISIFLDILSWYIFASTAKVTYFYGKNCFCETIFSDKSTHISCSNIQTQGIKIIPNQIKFRSCTCTQNQTSSVIFYRREYTSFLSSARHTILPCAPYILMALIIIV